MSLTLTNDDVEQLLSAIGVAEGEIGDGCYSVKDKLLEMYPKVKHAREEREATFDRDLKEQQDARKSLADLVFNNLQKDQPILPQLRSIMTKQFYDTVVRENYSDEVCLSGDLFKHHFNDLKELGLLKELREWLKLEGQKKGHEWMENEYKLTSDEDLWHELSKNFKEALKD